MSTEVLLAVIFVLVFSILAVLLWSWRSAQDHRHAVETSRIDDFEMTQGGTDCPLCGEHLPRGTRVHSVVFPGREFDLMRIYGCPHCWEGHALSPSDDPENTRVCPYCHEKLPVDGYVMAQVYHKPYHRTHVHVYGCTVCKPGRG